MLRTTALCLCITASLAHANPATLVPTAADIDSPTLFHVTVDYEYVIDSARIRREIIGGPPGSGIAKVNDLKFHQYRHILVPKLELGVLKDAWISFAVPLVLAQSRELELDTPSRAQSTTILDGLLPEGGFDAKDPSTPFPESSRLMFRGQNRSGVQQLRFGLGVAFMNQQRDATKPTWKIGADLHVAVGKVMRFDAMNTAAETGVSTGVHELKLWTTMARRYSRLEGYFELFWLVPLTAREASLFDDIDQQPGTFGATNTLPGQKGGMSFGVEVFAIDDQVNHNTVSLDVGGRVVGHFEGRDYSEMWEVFALAGDVRRDGPLVIDRDPSADGLQAVSHPGISNIENYLETALRFGIRGQLNRRIHFGVIADLAWKTDHAITFADAGVDLPTCTGSNGVEGRDCEADTNDLVNPSSGEVNPLHVPRIDLVGHRYLSVDNFSFSVGVHAQVLF